MTYALGIDPGLNSGLALGYYDSTTPFQLVERWQVHEGVPGFLRWAQAETPEFDELVVEKFLLRRDNQFTADTVPLELEGCIHALRSFDRRWDKPLIFQPATMKATLTGGADEKERKRRRRDLLERLGIWKPGEDNFDSNEAIMHILISLKHRKHLPTMKLLWPPRNDLAT